MNNLASSSGVISNGKLQAYYSLTQNAIKLHIIVLETELDASFRFENNLLLFDLSIILGNKRPETFTATIGKLKGVTGTEIPFVVRINGSNKQILSLNSAYSAFNNGTFGTVVIPLLK